MGLDRARREGGAIGLAGPKKTFNHGRHGTTRKNAIRKIWTWQAFELVEG